MAVVWEPGWGPLGPGEPFEELELFGKGPNRQPVGESKSPSWSIMIPNQNVCMYVCMLEDPNEDRQCGGLHVFHNDLSPAPLKGPPPSHQAEVGGSPRLKLLPLIFKSSSADAAAQFLQKSDF